MPRVLFQGPGAGSLPTTSAVVADALDAAVSISNSVYWPHSFRREEGVKPLPIAEVQSRYYLRVGVVDEPGVLARVTGVLGDAAHQHRLGPPEGTRWTVAGGDRHHDARLRARPTCRRPWSTSARSTASPALNR